MARRTAVQAALAALLLTALAACSSSGGDRGSATAQTVATEPPTTTTTNPYAVPAVIDAAYVNRVLAGLDAAVGDIVRLVTRTRTIPPEALERMKAVYLDYDRIQRSIDGFQRDMRNNFSTYKPNPGNKVTVVTELISANPNCIFAKVRRDYSAVGTSTAAAVYPQWISLKRHTAVFPPDYNPTPWGLAYDGFPEDLSSPANPCVR